MSTTTHVQVGTRGSRLEALAQTNLVIRQLEGRRVRPRRESGSETARLESGDRQPERGLIIFTVSFSEALSVALEKMKKTEGSPWVPGRELIPDPTN